mgnify:CR=1 FL=1
MFPADELYGEWTNEWVNPFRGKKVDLPDSCIIDCSTFVLPMDSMTRVTSKYGPRRRRMHKGIDLKVQMEIRSVRRLTARCVSRIRA